jgi:hypothetical protein
MNHQPTHPLPKEVPVVAVAADTLADAAVADMDIRVVMALQVGVSTVTAGVVHPLLKLLPKKTTKKKNKLNPKKKYQN